MSRLWTRRRLLQWGVLGSVLPLATSAVPSCLTQEKYTMVTPRQTRATTHGRLQSRPVQPTQLGTPGLHGLGLDVRRDGLFYVPASYQIDRPAPLILMLHGAGGDADGAFKILQHQVDAIGAIVLAVDSRRQTWDVIVEQYGADIAFIDQALASIFSRYAINPQRLAIAGFSDGASYALSVGVTNGDLFSHIMAFSPGFMAPSDQIEEPQIFISHGTGDQVLPIDRCSRRLVPRLQQAGYPVRYEEFNGPHTVPSAIVQTALDWFTTPPSGRS